MDDGSTDATPGELARLAAIHPGLRVLRHDRPAGKTAAVHNGVLAARAPLVATIDGDGQNPAAEIARLLAPLAEGRVGLVAGQRRARRDTPAKRAASRAANALRGWALGDRTRDTACGLKAFRREAFLALPYFDNMHRFLPALFRAAGWEVRLVEVEDRPRLSGRSKYTNAGARGVRGDRPPRRALADPAAQARDGRPGALPGPRRASRGGARPRPRPHDRARRMTGPA